MSIFYPVQLLADWLTFDVFHLTGKKLLASSVNFFIYDTIKIFILLAVIIFAVSIIRTFLSPERIRAILSRRNKYVGNILAAVLGIYSNAAGVIPLVSALAKKGVAIGTTLAFMMAVTALPLPEFLILKRVMKTKLILIFAQDYSFTR